MFECQFCQRVSDDEPVACSLCEELKCEDCIPGGMFTPCLDCEEQRLGLESGACYERIQFSSLPYNLSRLVH